MINDKLKIIYEPASYIKDQRLLATMCIYYDEVLLFHNDKIDENNYSNVKNQEFYNFLVGQYRHLSKEGILKIYSPEDVDHYFPEAKTLEIALKRPELKKINNKEVIELKIENDNMNNLTKVLLDSINPEKVGKRTNINDFIRNLCIYSVAESEKIAVFSNNPFIPNSKDYINQVNYVSNNLALLTLQAFAIPELVVPTVEEILFVREELRNELLQFRAAILELTYILCKNLSSQNYSDIIFECNLLINTKIKAAVLSLQNKISKHNKSKIKNMLLNSSSLLLSAGNLFVPKQNPLGTIKNILVDSQKLIQSSIPEDRIATFILNSNQYIKDK